MQQSKFTLEITKRNLFQSIINCIELKGLCFRDNKSGNGDMHNTTYSYLCLFVFAQSYISTKYMMID